MDNQTTILAFYESISDAANQMLQAARQSDWDTLVIAERSCADLIKRLQAAGDPSAVLDAQGSKRKFELIRKVLAHDAEIRNLTQPWLRQLEAHLGQNRATQRVESAYRP